MDRQTLFSLLVGFLFVFLFFRLINSPTATVNETIGSVIDLEIPENSTKSQIEENITEVSLERVDTPVFLEEVSGINDDNNDNSDDKIPKQMIRKKKKKAPSEKTLISKVSKKLGQLKLKINVNINKKQPKKDNDEAKYTRSGKLTISEIKKKIREDEELIKIFGAIDNGIFLKNEKEAALNYTFEATQIIKKGWSLESDNLTYGFFLVSYATALQHKKILQIDSKNDSYSLVFGLSPFARGIRNLEDETNGLAAQHNSFLQIYLKAVADFTELMNLTNRETLDFDELIQFWQYFYASLLPTLFEISQDEMSDNLYDKQIERTKQDYAKFFSQWKRKENNKEYLKFVEIFLSIIEDGTNGLKESINESKMISGDTIDALETKLYAWCVNNVLDKEGSIKAEYKSKDYRINYLLIDLSRSTFIAHGTFFEFKWKALDKNLKIYFFKDLIQKISKFTQNIPRIESLQNKIAKIIKFNEKRPRLDFIDWVVLFQILIDLIYEKL